MTTTVHSNERCNSCADTQTSYEHDKRERHRPTSLRLISAVDRKACGRYLKLGDTSRATLFQEPFDNLQLVELGQKEACKQECWHTAEGKAAAQACEQLNVASSIAGMQYNVLPRLPAAEGKLVAHVSSTC